ncbi:nuclear transport factor 2 family protein [Saccharopolyspora erythraea]|uniref:nuclear transport factor 2 family protein n=1 Tax=Saccharopolyspora erythraea TaxID=1836 RepID=UPI001BADC6B8|nr:nuclear transport factor 2 family protein [Saccharopolyspora erythraea]QUH00716.1 nuclear transport factor 2 family protein [Saccharopolyspora erythraea]
MTTPTDQLRTLTDHTEITGLIDRFFRALDERGLDLPWGRSMFTDDVRATFPIGKHQGLEAVVTALADGMSRFGPTQHSGSNYLIDVDGDRATVRWNAIQTHLPPGETPVAEPFVSGGYYDGELIRTEDGWRFRRQTYHLVWTTGRLPQGT